MNSGKFRLTLSEPRFNAVETFNSQSPFGMHHRFCTDSMALYGFLHPVRQILGIANVTANICRAA